MLRRTSLGAIPLAAMLAATPLVAEAQSYRCVGADGKKYYGQTIPRACIGQVVEQLNAQGLVIRRIDPKGTAADREAGLRAVYLSYSAAARICVRSLLVAASSRVGGLPGSTTTP